MKKIGCYGWTLVLGVCCLTVSAQASEEREPNNFEQEASSIAGFSVRAQVNDDKDWFKVGLPAKGPVTVSLQGLPDDLTVQLGVKGFPHVGWQDGKGDLSYTFEAENTEGLIWVMFQFAQNVCGYDWCASRFSANGPWYGVKPSAGMPAAHDGVPILAEIPAYTLTLTGPGMTPPAATAVSGWQDDAAKAVEWESEEPTGKAVEWEDEPAPAPPSQIIWEEEGDIGG